MRRALFALVLAAGPLAAAAPTGDRGPAAELPGIEALAAARARLAAADESSDGSSIAKTQTSRDVAAAIRGTEGAIERLRSGIAGAEREERAMLADLAVREPEMRRLVAALVATARQPDPPVAAHPGGTVAAARAARMLEPARAALEAEAAALRARLAALAKVRRVKADGEAEIVAALEAIAAAQARLRETLVADGSGAAPAGPLAPDSAGAALVGASDTLTDLAARLAGQGGGGAPRGARVSARNAPEGVGDIVPLAAPVGGAVLRGFAEANAAGERRPGLTFAGAPGSLVTAPAAGRVAYVGPFLDFRTVAVIEIAPATTVVLAGLAEAAVTEGAQVEAGDPIGFLGGSELAPQEYLTFARYGTGAFPPETLYMEVLRRTEPVDPGPWLAGRG